MRDETGREYFDYEFDERFEPCDSMPWLSLFECGSTRRIARYFPVGPRIAFLCDQGHRTKWEGRGPWIPLDVFREGGEYGGMLPLPEVAPRNRPGLSTTIKISNAAEYRARTAHACCVCDCPPFDNEPLKQQLRTIAQHKRFLYHDIWPYIKPMVESAVYSDDWFHALPIELQAAVRLSAAESRIQADHGVPRTLLQTLWFDLSSKERTVALNALAFPLCGFCNKGKRNQLDATDIIIKRFAKVRYAGDEILAAQDEAYAYILSICEKAQAVSRRLG